MSEQKWKDECYTKWGISVEEANKQTQAIRVPGMRLSMEEKHTLFYHKMEWGAHIEDEDVAMDIVLNDRRMEEECKKAQEKIDCFEKELTRLSGEDQTGCVSDAPFYEYETICEGIEYLGAKEYADFWFRTRF